MYFFSGIEDDETYGPCVVGRGGARNRMGHLELDAAIMEGNELGFGAVTALRGVSRAVSVARRVMEKSVSTSGKSGKYPGRVGDSALPGCGLYADNKIGGACCTGDGDEILKYCPCFHAVQLMKQSET
ncbi:hypothetical protein KUTeg_017875 [Tegillarca granosa]|uniref:Uncharacterized protein n=1 Tax=Tegillarca granosa TaxID=220873 RepID=A0ABQ9EK28_TEGGR|nr:hypothetical protein KUTeg_017875 [Tegillarca granosa]